MAVTSMPPSGESSGIRGPLSTLNTDKTESSLFRYDTMTCGLERNLVYVSWARLSPGADADPGRLGAADLQRRGIWPCLEVDETQVLPAELLPLGNEVAPT